MRVLLIAQYFPPRRSSFSSRWEWLTAGLAHRGHDVDVVALMSAARQMGNLRHALDADPPVDRVRIRPVLPVWTSRHLAWRAVGEALAGARALAHALRAPRPDVVVASVPALVVLPIGWLAARMWRVPLVLDLRDAWPELIADWREWDDDGTGPRASAPRPPSRRGVRHVAADTTGRVVGWLRRHADAVVVTTQRLADHLDRSGLRSVALVRNTSAKPWDYALAPPRAESGELRVLYLGNVGRAQLLATAVRAAALASARGVRIRLRIVGAGPQWEAVHRLALATGAPVEFVERVPTHQVLPHYRWADSVLVILRGWTALADTVPSKLYEVLLTGRHISASIRGETADLVTGLGAGDVVPPEDAEALATLWQQLAADRSRLRVSGRGRAWVRSSLTTELLSAEFERILDEAVHG